MNKMLGVLLLVIWLGSLSPSLHIVWGVGGGESQDASATAKTFDQLIGELSSANWRVRQQAVTTLKELAPEHLADLSKVIDGKGIEFQWRLHDVLGSLQWEEESFLELLCSQESGHDTLPLIHYGLTLANGVVRRQLVERLSALKSFSSLDKIQTACQDSDPLVREAAALALIDLDPKGVSKKILRELLEDDHVVAMAALHTIQTLDLEEMFYDVFPLLDHSDPNVVGLANQFLIMHNSKKHIPFYKFQLDEGQGNISKQFACYQLGAMKAGQALDSLIQRLEDKTELLEVKQAACKAIQAVGLSSAVSSLEKVYLNSDRKLRKMVLEIVETLDESAAKVMLKREKQTFAKEMDHLLDNLVSDNETTWQAASERLIVLGADAHQGLWKMITDTQSEDLRWRARLVIAERDSRELMALQLLENKMKLDSLKEMMRRGNNLNNMEWYFNPNSKPHIVPIHWRSVSGVSSKLKLYKDDIQSGLRSDHPSALKLLDYIVTIHKIIPEFHKVQIQIQTRKKFKDKVRKEMRVIFKPMLDEIDSQVRMVGMICMSFASEAEDLEYFTGLINREGEDSSWNYHVVLAVEKIASMKDKVAAKAAKNKLHEWMSKSKDEKLTDAAHRSLKRISKKDFARSDTVLWQEYIDSLKKESDDR